MTGECTDKSAAVLLEGGFEEAPFARVFYKLCKDKLTGVLDLRDQTPPKGKVLKRIYIQSGEYFHVQGGTVEETLGRVLVKTGKLSEDNYEALRKHAEGNFSKMEDLLITGGPLPPHEIHEAVTMQTNQKIKGCFALVKGHYQFKACPAEDFFNKYFLVQLIPEKVMVEAIGETYPEARLKREFVGLDKKKWVLSKDFRERLNAFGFLGGQFRFTRNITDGFYFPAVVKSSGIKPEQATALLLTFYFAGMIDLAAGEEAFPLGKVYAAAPPKPEPAKARPQPEEAKKEVKEEIKKPAAVKLPIEEELDRKYSDEEVIKVIEKFVGLAHDREKSYFDLFGIDENTPGVTIKKIYLKMAKLFHPDARPDFYQGEIKEEVENLFTRISEAYSVLSDNEQRRNYTTKIKSKVTDAQMEEANRAIQAEVEFQKAEIMLRKKNYPQAEELFRRALELMPSEPDYKMYHTWAVYKKEGQGKMEWARREINKILKEKPNMVDGHMFLGLIARSDNDDDEALAHFRKVLELRPNDVEAQREIRVLQTRREKTPPKKGGLFGKR